MTKTWLAIALAAAGCMNSPTNGQTTSVVVGKTFNFGGKVSQPNLRIDVEILNSPTLDPAVNGNWTRIATTYSKAIPDAPDVWNDEHPAYSWSASARPVPTTAQLARWPDGGLARFRAVHVNANGNRLPLATFDDVNLGCLTDQVTSGVEWDTAGAHCEGMGNRTAVMVHTSTLPDPAPAFGFLTDKGVGSILETALYYAKIDAPSTLPGFQLKYGLFPPASPTVSARYFNDGDLGIGREMNCRTFPSSNGTGVACFVRNYSDTAFQAPDFNENPADVIAQTVFGLGAFATVAMVYEPDVQTKFIVYGADDKLAFTAPLDKSQDNISIPQNCLGCHGIDATYNANTHEIVGNAEFLPFDPYSFQFSSSAPWRLVDQQEAIRQLNAMVKMTNAPWATNQLIDGMYAPLSVNQQGAVANNTYVPPGWHDDATSTDFDGKSLYNGVVKPYCRTCHVSSNDPGLAFSFAGGFLANADLIRQTVCGTKKMPHAERVQKRFWQSGARAYIATGLPVSYPNQLLECKP